MNLDDYLACASCRKATHKYEVFPGNICLSCYEQTPEATAPLTAQGLADLTKMWGGK
jgi:hypothetical protein